MMMPQYLPLHDVVKSTPIHHFPERYDYKVVCDHTNNSEDGVPLIDNPSGMYCPDCRATSVSHCSDPEYCSGMIPMRTPKQIEARFLCLEGMDFSGKTTVVNLLEEYFKSTNTPYIKTREPGGCEMAEKLRSIVLDNSTVLTPMSELLLFMAARNEHLHTVIIPALKEGKVVLSDRFLGSSFIYQGLGKKLGALQVNTAFTLLLRSNMEYSMYLDHHTQTFVLDISHGVAMERARTRGEVANRLDVTEYNQFTEQRVGYKSLPNCSDLFKRNFHIIDAENSPSSIASLILQTARGATK
jgi:dTMP kinase